MSVGTGDGAHPDVEVTLSAGDLDIDPNAVYSLGSSAGESQRLERQAEELASESELRARSGGLTARRPRN
jgi:hypothetical protein